MSIRRYLITVLIIILSPSFALAYSIDHIHFLIPGGKSGGWDITARQAAKVMLNQKIVTRVSYENLSGAGGSRALLELIAAPEQHNNTLMVQSMPLILRSVTGVIDKGFRDISPISLLITEFQVIAVPVYSEFSTLSSLLRAIHSSPEQYPVLGGSSLFSLDHITMLLVMRAYSGNAQQLRYIPSNGGGAALQRLLSGTGSALVTGYGEVIEAANKGLVRILAISSQDRLVDSNIPTFVEQGVDVVLSNWRGFFAHKSTPAEKAEEYIKAIRRLSVSEQWRDIRHQFGWSPLVLSGDEFYRFLIEQELMVQEILNDINETK